jgi:hypothetical protein
LRELYATGGTTQTLLFGTLAFLLASWLALSDRQHLTTSRRWLRFASYAGWGLVVGLAIWSDLIVLPILMMASLLLLLFCWRDLHSLALLFLLLGFVIGAFPLIVYNLHPPPEQDSLSMLVNLFHGGTHMNSPHTLPQLIRGIEGTVSVSLPTATGDPFCPVPAVEYASDASPHSLPCTLLHTTWSAGYLLLWLLSVLLTITMLWRLRSFMQSGSLGERRGVVLHVARLCLLASAAVSLIVYMVSSGPQDAPHSHARYLIGLLIVTPALLWPAWRSATAPAMREIAQGGCARPRLTSMFNRGVLLLITLLFLLGTISIVSDLSSSQGANQQQDELIATLEHIGATHIYSDFWTCDRITFVSQEKIICGVIGSDLSPTHNYYAPYYTVVHADPHSAYVFTYDIFQKASILREAEHTGRGFRRFVFAGYIVYQPE